MTDTRAIGMAHERYAALLLERAGYQITARNVRTRSGELDVIAWEGATLCFVEVRSTDNADHGGPLATVGRDKQRRVVRAAREYLMTVTPEPAVRFDVLGLWREQGELRHLLVRGAFDAGR